MAGGNITQSDLTRKPVKRSTDISAIQTRAAARDEEVRNWLPLEEAIPAIGICGEDFSSRGMQRNQTRLAELRSMNREYPFGPIHIFYLQVKCFADAHAGRRQQSEQTVVGPRLQRGSRAQILRSFQQLSDFFCRVQVRSCTLGTMGQQAQRWYLGARIFATAVTGEPSYDTQASGPLRRLLVLRLGGKLQCQADGETSRIFSSSERRGTAAGNAHGLSV